MVDTMTEAEANHDIKILVIGLLERCHERGIQLKKDKIKLKKTEVQLILWEPIGKVWV